MYIHSLHLHIHTVVLEKFIGENFHVKKFLVNIFAFLGTVLNENFVTVNNYLVEVLPLIFCYKVLCKQFIQACTCEL